MTNEYDGSAMAKLADIRGWVRNQMHKQSQDKFEKTTLRKYQTLTRTADTLQKQNVELRRQLERTKALLAKSENELDLEVYNDPDAGIKDEEVDFEHLDRNS